MPSERRYYPFNSSIAIIPKDKEDSLGIVMATIAMGFKWGSGDDTEERSKQILDLAYSSYREPRIILKREKYGRYIYYGSNNAQNYREITSKQFFEEADD